MAWLNITGCDFASKKSAKPIEPPPFAQKDISIEKARDIAKSTNKQDGFTVNPVALKNEETKLAKPAGLKTDSLFNEPIANDDARFLRLENTVQNISEKLNDMDPSVKKLIGIERDFDNLTFQLETLIDQGKFDKFNIENTNISTRNIPMQSSSDPQTQIPRQSTIDPNDKYAAFKRKYGSSARIGGKPASKTYTRSRPAPKIAPGNIIKTMRIGDHNGKTRIVIDATQKLSLSPIIDNSENLITLDLGAASLGSNPNALARSSKLFNALSQSKDSAGNILILETTRNTALTNQGYIKPNKDSASHRHFFDFSR